MKYFTDFEILRSIYLSLFFGIFLACIFVASDSFCYTVKRIFATPADTLKLVRNFSAKSLKCILAKREDRKREKVNNVYDAIIFSLFGVLFILHFYVILDGNFRIYAFFISIVTFAVFKKTVGRLFSIIFKKIFLYIKSAVLFLCALAALPMYKILKFMTKILCKRMERTKEKYLLRKSKILVSRKLTEIRKLMEAKDIYPGV